MRATAEHTPFLIVGAGPFGLAMAAQAQAQGIDHVVLGEPMSFWKRHMPEGMVLRSGCDWHLDPTGRDTIERFLAARGQRPADVEPLSLSTYLDYAEWFRTTKDIEPRAVRVIRLDEHHGRLVATLHDGAVLTADRILLAIGFAPFAHVPPELAALVPSERSSHTSHLDHPTRFGGQRVLIVGGRQSAFESAALLAEAGAAAVHVCHRHDTPAFLPSDWTWVEPPLERIVAEPGWFRRLPPSDRDALSVRFWEEGRLKLEPWLGPRVHHPAITIRPRTRVVGCDAGGGTLRIELDGGERVEVEHVLYATGYQVDLARVRMLADGNLATRMETHEGFPVLDDSMQTSVPGLFMTSLPATHDFGLFFAFTVSVRASARIIGRALT